MALLTAEDVYDKKFTPTKRRSEGYDQEEVDEFLDEVIATLRERTSTVEELQAQLDAAERRIAELTTALDEAEARLAGRPAIEPEAAGAPVVEEVVVDEVPEPQLDAYVAREEPVQDTPVSEPVATTEPVESAAGMLALAQRLHDEYVANGREEAERALADARAEADRLLTEARGEHQRLLGEGQGEHERLVAEGRTEHERLLSEARAESDRLVREAEDTHHRTLASLEQEKALLERKIEELQVFERDYRTRLTTYLQKLLADVGGRSE